MSPNPLFTVLALAQDWLRLIPPAGPNPEPSGILNALRTDLLQNGLDIRARLATALNRCDCGPHVCHGQADINASELNRLENFDSTTTQNGEARRPAAPRPVENAVAALLMCCHNSNRDAIDLRAELTHATAVIQHYLDSCRIENPSPPPPELKPN